MLLIEKLNALTFAGIYKFNYVDRFIIYIALIIPHKIVKDDPISKFNTKILTDTAREPMSIK